MNLREIIRKLLASVILSIFVFSIMPKKFLHDLLSNHLDTLASSPVNDCTSHVNVAVFHCQCDNLVAESPFDEEQHIFNVTAPVFILSHHIQYSYPYVYTADFFFELRGPPVYVTI